MAGNGQMTRQLWAAWRGDERAGEIRQRLAAAVLWRRGVYWELGWWCFRDLDARKKKGSRPLDKNRAVQTGD
jgi:hypothetical protein